MSLTPRRPSGYLNRPDYRVDLLRRPNQVVAQIDGIVLAESNRAILVDEQDHALAVYFPREDVAMDRLVAVEGKTTHCPYKGDAGYFALAGGDGEPIAWSYPQPYHEVAAIADYIAFHQDRVAVALGSPASTNA